MTGVLAWGDGWAPINEDGSAQEIELTRELGPDHPLHRHQRVVFGRCLKCDDVLVAISCMPGEPEMAVVHLTWRGDAEGAEWPYFERMTMGDFRTRFLEGGEHL